MNFWQSQSTSTLLLLLCSFLPPLGFEQRVSHNGDGNSDDAAAKDCFFGVL
jgi:hypothetical protein